MPKNIIPKDNIPKIEEVRKIENEIPSYEEFLKNYQDNEQINHDDLAHEDISSSKGYGPCSFANPNCTCYASQGFIQLYTPCPAVGCSNRNVATWLHSKNGYLMTSTNQNDECGILLISIQGQIRCASCGTTSHFSNWNFNCHDYRHSGGHKKPTFETFANALSFVGANAGNRDSNVRSVLRQLTIHLFNSL